MILQNNSMATETNEIHFYGNVLFSVLWMKSIRDAKPCTAEKGWEIFFEIYSSMRQFHFPNETKVEMAIFHATWSDVRRCPKHSTTEKPVLLQNEKTNGSFYLCTNNNREKSEPSTSTLKLPLSLVLTTHYLRFSWKGILLKKSCFISQLIDFEK